MGESSDKPQTGDIFKAVALAVLISLLIWLSLMIWVAKPKNVMAPVLLFPGFFFMYLVAGRVLYEIGHFLFILHDKVYGIENDGLSSSENPRTDKMYSVALWPLMAILICYALAAILFGAMVRMLSD
jgi:hypothetical protein